MRFRHYEYMSAAGILDLYADQENIVGLWFHETTPDYFRHHSDDIINEPISLAVLWLDNYFAGNRPSIHNLPLNPKGTIFQKAGWSSLKSIPYASTLTYGQIADAIAKTLGKEKMSAQAVGQAVGANPISVIIPCHRVIGANGNLVGYAAGLDKKIALLKHEGYL